jgi:hypothetical protein
MVVRTVIGVIAGLVFLAGIAILLLGGDARLAGISPTILGGGALIAVVLERQRYRSVAAEATREPAGPGGGEPAPLPAQFHATEERFVDPTSGRMMRVFLDERTGERRYRAEG